MRRVYIAGPMRGRPEFNFPAFFAAEERLYDEHGHEDLLVFNPARRDVEAYGEDLVTGTTGKLEEIPQFSLREALGFDLDWICRHATEVYLLKGWSLSKGATAERAVALALGLDVTYENPRETETQGEADAYGEGYYVGFDDGQYDG